MSESTYIQEINISSDTTHYRVAVHWNKSKDVEDWKVLSIVRYKPFWIHAQLHQTLASHPHLASHLLLLKSRDGPSTLVVYPISTLTVNHVLLVEDGKIKSNVNRVLPTSKEEKVWVVCYEAIGPIEERRSVSKVVDIARGLVGSTASDDDEGKGKEESDDLWDGLGICTWESFFDKDGKRIRPTKDLLLSLIPSDLPIKTFLIDDGWQDTLSTSTHRRLMSFKPYEDFGGTLKEVVDAIKDSGVEKVGVWLTLQGYWEGIHPSSTLIETYDCVEYQKGKPNGGLEDEGQPDGNSIWLPPPHEARRFWDDWFGQLKEAGINFIKCDNQADSEMAIDPRGFHAQQSLWSTMLDSAQSHFGIRGVIMCMAQNERMLNGPGGLNFDRPKGDLVFRNSDDFNMNYSNTHPDHTHFNTYNTILTSHLCLIPDFDMFASSPSKLLPIYHALLRALGPGPILLSDTPQNPSDTRLISKLLATTKDGKKAVIKSPRPVQVLSNRWFLDNLKGNTDGPALVAGTRFDEGVGGLIGVWNVHDHSPSAIAKDKITWRDIEDLLDLEENDASEYCLTTPMRLSAIADGITTGRIVTSSNGGSFEVGLKKGECELVCVSKLYSFEGFKVGLVGLKDKFACMSGLMDIKVDQKKNTLEFTSKYISEVITLIVIRHQPIQIEGTSVHLYVDDVPAHSTREVASDDGRNGAIHLVDFDIPEKVSSGTVSVNDEGGLWKIQVVGLT
ncbi:hypothetical protein I204_08086 [Kwoniella mangroviensis CBS 8886]|uniref:uncharacterized protein n=1 Tax=Kwoniella mangroviensis CBS 8507 TaxID=1296122 RepID=UPI00080D1477|nr:uncharacterized protein I203_04555 [Kwoniella mangroviensis CBS 8507]OCF66228.1 hypothetical protein I203_04555 [Kwoniella mangroviensis CBS 8507]OCF71134.1 hypothetical protein I204_08086 [Kwoniella mangroviensis CBS 8886]